MKTICDEIVEYVKYVILLRKPYNSRAKLPKDKSIFYNCFDIKRAGNKT